MKSKLKKIAFLVIGLLIAVVPNNLFNFNSEVKTELSIPRQSASVSFIHVDNNWTDTLAEPWCKLVNGKYVIENVTIDASASPTGSGILINNSNDEEFIIRNCTIYDAVAGPSVYYLNNGSIKLVNSSKGQIYSNNLTSSTGADTWKSGICLYESKNVAIINNTIEGNTYGVFLRNSNETLIFNNSVNSNYHVGIMLQTNCHYNNITQNNASYNTLYHGITLNTNSDNNNIINNTANENVNYYGINLNDGCDNNTIIGNNVSLNHDGIYLKSSDNNTIQGNIANDNVDEGIDLNEYCDYNRVIGNTANNNPSEGIQVYSYGDFNIISGNNVSNNDNGIRLHTNCGDNTIIDNNASNNRAAGIYLNTGSEYNNITENIVNNNNQRGIYLTTCHFNVIINNTVNDNDQHGIELSNTDNNTIKNNTINRNELGILLDRSNNNTVTENTLMDNGFCIYEFNSLDNIIEDNYCTSPTLLEPIFINGTAIGAGAYNWTWAVSQSWCSGSGTWSDPYVIDNLIINGFGMVNCIEIINSNSFFIIQNCILYNGNDHGITLENVNNSRLINNNCSDNVGENGISLFDGCNNNTISGNTASGNNYVGIYLYDYCDNNTISGNTVNDNNNEGIYLYSDCDYNKITGNTVNGNNYGIYFDTECDNNTISGNTVNNNTYEGIYIYDECDNNKISGNTVNDNDHDGIYLEIDCDYNNITGNIVNGNTDYGIYLYSDCHNNTISGNTVNDNYDGISLGNSCDNNFIGGNTANGNDYGIYLNYNCNYNSITGNTANGNSNDGMYIYDLCSFNNITGNTINNNELDGIEIDECHDNIISENTINYNGEIGIYFYYRSLNNTISGNTISYNLDIGIYLKDQSDFNNFTNNVLYNNTRGMIIDSNNENNSIYENFFLKNGKHAVDEGTDNKWNSSTIGNYWDNWTSPDISPNDGIVDHPYNISGSPGSKDHFPIAEDGTPSITINSPDPGDVFGSIAPSFNMRITDDYLDEMWYTLDSGLNNYTFTVNGSIDQSAWDAAPEGSITLTFYASDIPGNISSAEVLIIKDNEIPTVYINSPDPDDIFGSDAPSFNVRITDDYLDETWYTFDGGLTTYLFTDNGTIDQDAWDAVPEGNVTLTFHAIDDLGHVGSAGVDITKDYEAPTVYINSPASGEYFGSSAPSFNVRIIDDYIDTMWYTLDGGLNNYTFTANGTLDQSAWNAVAEGAVILKFYANDTLGHVGSAEVSIMKDATAPIIVINSPVEGDRFGKNAPLFNITITEVNLDSIWYSFDGGVTTYTITDNTIFNQTAWTALSQGEVTITFYARDLAGNEASESVTVIKSVPSGLEPGVIITIVVISIVGGVAVIAGVYVFMKKRATPT